MGKSGKHNSRLKREYKRREQERRSKYYIKQDRVPKPTVTEKYNEELASGETYS